MASVVIGCAAANLKNDRRIDICKAENRTGSGWHRLMQKLIHKLSQKFRDKYREILSPVKMGK